jgi:hypothetical protein
MNMARQIKVIKILILSMIVIFPFQNCGKFQSDSPSQNTGNFEGLEDPNNLPTDPPPPPPPSVENGDPIDPSTPRITVSKISIPQRTIQLPADQYACTAYTVRYTPRYANGLWFFTFNNNKPGDNQEKFNGEGREGLVKDCLMSLGYSESLATQEAEAYWYQSDPRTDPPKIVPMTFVHKKVFGHWRVQGESRPVRALITNNQVRFDWFQHGVWKAESVGGFKRSMVSTNWRDFIMENGSKPPSYFPFFFEKD